MVTVLNTLTGKTAETPRWIFESPLYNVGQLVEVKKGTKPYVGAYKPKTAEQFEEIHPDKVVAADSGDDEDKAEEAEN